MAWCGVGRPRAHPNPLAARLRGALRVVLATGARCKAQGGTPEQGSPQNLGSEVSDLTEEGKETGVQRHTKGAAGGSGCWRELGPSFPMVLLLPWEVG